MKTLLPLLLLACADDKTLDSYEEMAAPAVTWLVPSEGDVVAAGDLSCSLLVENFTLESATMHTMGAAAGHVTYTVDGGDALETNTTTPTLTLTAGTHTLSAQLLYTDGDEVTTLDGMLCDEEDAGCEPVVASVTVTAE